MNIINEPNLNKEAQKIATVATVTAAVLAITKLGLYISTGSLVIALSAWDSAVDSIISLINRRVIQFARQEADENHPYGHGKAEYIAALAQGCMILGGGITILVAAIKSFWSLDFTSENTQSLISPFFSSALFIVFALVSWAITRFMRAHGTRLSSPALIADATHYAVDVASNIATSISLLILALTGFVWLDSFFSMALALYLGYGGFGLILESVHNLMDRALPKGMKNTVIQNIFNIDNRILEIHRFRGRISGYKTFLDFHVCLPKNLTFEEAHCIADKIEKAISLEFQADVVVHVDLFDGTYTSDSILPGQSIVRM